MERDNLVRWTVALAAAALFSGCGRDLPWPGPAPSPSPPASPGPTPPPPTASPAPTPAPALTLRPIGSGPMSGIKTEVTQVIRDAAAWRELWERHDPTRPPPVVDFATEMVAVVILQRNTGGYRVRIEDARREDGRVIVTYDETAPGPDEPVIQVLTQPWSFAALPRTDEPVDFEAR